MQAIPMIILATATAAKVGSDIYSGVKQHQAMQLQANNYKLQASQSLLRTQADQTQTAIQDADRQRKLRTILSSQIAIFGSAGIDVGSGTPVDLAVDSYTQAQREGQQAASYAQLRRTMLRGQYITDLNNMSASQAQGKTALMQGFLNAGADAFGAAATRFNTGNVPQYQPGSGVQALQDTYGDLGSIGNTGDMSDLTDL